MEINELKKMVEKQAEANISIYKSIPRPTHDDPLNEKAEPILKQWWEGGEKLRELTRQLHEMEAEQTAQQRSLNTTPKQTKKTFINSFGEATTRTVECAGYKRAQKRMEKEILCLMGIH